MTTEAELTMVLTNWARTDQMHQVIAELKQQSIPIKVVVWNNNPEITFQNPLADLIINSSQNTHGRLVPGLMQMVDTPYVGRMDDDLHFTDDDLMEEALAALKEQKCSTQMVGAWGLRVFEDGAYEDGHHFKVPKGHGQRQRSQNFRVDLLKGRILLATTAGIAKVLCNCRHYHADLDICMTMAGKKRWHHTLAGCFFDRTTETARLVDFPPDDKGYCHMANHMLIRNHITKAWAANCEPDPRVIKRPPNHFND